MNYVHQASFWYVLSLRVTSETLIKLQSHKMRASTCFSLIG